MYNYTIEPSHTITGPNNFVIIQNEGLKILPCQKHMYMYNRLMHLMTPGLYRGQVHFFDPWSIDRTIVYNRSVLFAIRYCWGGVPKFLSTAKKVIKCKYPPYVSLCFSCQQQSTFLVSTTPKEDLVKQSPTKPSFGIQPPSKAFFWYENDNAHLRSVFARQSSV